MASIKGLLALGDRLATRSVHGAPRFGVGAAGAVGQARAGQAVGLFGPAGSGQWERPLPLKERQWGGWGGAGGRGDRQGQQGRCGAAAGIHPVGSSQEGWSGRPALAEDKECGENTP